MTYNIYLTHELIMETTKFYLPKNIKYSKEDFDRIDSINKTAGGKFFAVSGLIHLYGYKIAGEGIYSGFYDVINQDYYSKDCIKNAKIIEIGTECIYHSAIKPRMLRR